MKAVVKAGERDSGALLKPQQVAARLSVSLITVKQLLWTGRPIRVVDGIPVVEGGEGGGVRA